MAGFFVIGFHQGPHDGKSTQFAMRRFAAESGLQLIPIDAIGGAPRDHVGYFRQKSPACAQDQPPGRNIWPMLHVGGYLDAAVQKDIGNNARSISVWMRPGHCGAGLISMWLHLRELPIPEFVPTRSFCNVA